MNKSNRVSRRISAIVILVGMVGIFYMSAQPGDVSGNISGSVSHLFMQIWDAILGLDWSEVKILQMARQWDLPIRKLAHMTEFGILAGLVYWGIGYYEKLQHCRYIVAFAICVLYAITDEIHQLFVPDRDGNAVDVLIDSCGIVIVLCMVWAISKLAKMMDRRRTSEDSAQV